MPRGQYKKNQNGERTTAGGNESRNRGGGHHPNSSQREADHSNAAWGVWRDPTNYNRYSSNSTHYQDDDQHPWSAQHQQHQQQRQYIPSPSSGTGEELNTDPPPPTHKDASRLQAADITEEVGAYAVNLVISPVEQGIRVMDSKWLHQTIKGLGAFNRYFQLLCPRDGDSLVDVWDGYFHITIGKFNFNKALDPAGILRKERELRTLIMETQDQQKLAKSFPITFTANDVAIFTGEYREKDRNNIDFIVLPVSEPERGIWTAIAPLQQALKVAVDKVGGMWEAHPLDHYRDRLHVTIHKYSQLVNFSEGSTLFNEVQQTIREHPLEFDCTDIEVKPSRRQAIQRSDWYEGMTVEKVQENGNQRYVCAYCRQRIDKNAGCCLQCGKYERTKPLWSFHYGK